MRSPLFTEAFLGTQDRVSAKKTACSKFPCVLIKKTCLDTRGDQALQPELTFDDGSNGGSHLELNSLDLCLYALGHQWRERRPWLVAVGQELSIICA